MVSKKIRVTGVVQGVGYRFFCAYQARKLGVQGYAKNKPDGSVEVAAQGNASGVEAFIAQLGRGPSMAEVESLEVEDDNSGTSFVGFRTF